MMVVTTTTAMEEAHPYALPETDTGRGGDATTYTTIIRLLDGKSNEGGISMTRDVKNAVGQPDNSAFILRVLIYGGILAVMLFAAPALFAKIMVPMAAQGIKAAWYAIFVPLAAVLMGISLFRSWRRRWPRAYMAYYNAQVRANGYSYCPRCGAPVVEKTRRRSHTVKTGELVTTTTYSDGSKTVDRKDVYGTELRTEHYHVCSNGSCAIEADLSLGETHLPWRMKEIRCLVLNDSSLLGKKHPNARSILLSRLLVCILAAVIVIACGATVWGYADYQDGEWIGITADKEPERSAAEYADYLHGLDTAYPNWTLSYEKEATDMLGYLGNNIGKDETKGFFMGSYQTDDGVVLVYNFYGADGGSDVPDGEYTLMNLDGTMVLIDDTNKLIYKQDTEFYKTYAPKLQTLTYDTILKGVLEQVDGGEHGVYNGALPMEFVRKDNTTAYSYMKSNDPTQINGEFRVVTLHPEAELEERWIFTYRENEYVPNALEGYTYSDAMPLFDDSDELGKLIAKSLDDSCDYTLYRNDEEVVDVDVDVLANGYEICFSEWDESSDLRFEEDVDYRINTSEKTLVKITNDENYNRVSVDMPLSEYQKEYDYVMSIIPPLYIRNVIDMDEAEVKKEVLGLITNYVMKDESGNVVAEMKVMFGVIGEVIHHTGENEYVKLELEY